MFVAVSVGVAGWNTSAACFRTCSGLRGWWLGTLLGPEGTPAWCVLGGTIPGLAGLTHPGCPVWVVWLWWQWFGAGVWLCVECCIVDASILFVVKCVRAHGGCLGIRSR